MQYRSLRYWTCAFIWFPLSNLLHEEWCGILVSRLLFCRLASNLKIPLVDQMNAKGILYRLHCLCMLLMLYCFLRFPPSQEEIKFTRTACGAQGQCWWRPLGKVQPLFLWTHMHRAQIQHRACPHTLPYTPHGYNVYTHTAISMQLQSLLSAKWTWERRHSCVGSHHVEMQQLRLRGSQRPDCIWIKNYILDCIWKLKVIQCRWTLLSVRNWWHTGHGILD